MGIENRDYFRESSRYSDQHSGWSGSGLPKIVKFLIIANVVVYIGQIFVTRPMNENDIPPEIQERIEEFSDGRELTVQEKRQIIRHMMGGHQVSVLQEWGQLQTSKVVGQYQIWRVLTCAFLHARGTIWHLLFNMYALYLFGVAIEAMYGSREFIRFYLIAAIVSSLGYIGLDLATAGNTPAIGASGAVMGVSVLYAIHYPRHRLYIFGLIGVEVRFIVAFYIIYDIHPVLLELAGGESYSGVAHAAHLGGAAFGFAYWRSGIRLEKYLSWIKMPNFSGGSSAGRDFRVYDPQDDVVADIARDLEDEIDEILRKVHRDGEESLTDEEREILINASKRIKRRKD